MVNLKKYPIGLKEIGLILTFFVVISCSQRYHVEKIEGKEINVNENTIPAPSIEAFVKPYRENIDKDLNTVLAYSPQTLDKSGDWQTTIGNLLADVCLEKSNKIFRIREKKDVDICLLNSGGIRSIIPKGNVTTRTAFEIMPFENSLVVATLKGAQLLEIAQYIINERKAHPLAGMTFVVSADKQPKNIMIGGKTLEMEKVYYVVTSDYLLNGGDKMDFFKKSARNHDLDYKIRNVLIDYFKDVDTIQVITDTRIRKE